MTIDSNLCRGSADTQRTALLNTLPPEPCGPLTCLHRLEMWWRNVFETNEPLRRRRNKRDQGEEDTWCHVVRRQRGGKVAAETDTRSDIPTCLHLCVWASEEGGGVMCLAARVYGGESDNPIWGCLPGWRGGSGEWTWQRTVWPPEGFFLLLLLAAIAAAAREDLLVPAE